MDAIGIPSAEIASRCAISVASVYRIVCEGAKAPSSGKSRLSRSACQANRMHDLAANEPTLAKAHLMCFIALQHQQVRHRHANRCGKKSNLQGGPERNRSLRDTLFPAWLRMGKKAMGSAFSRHSGADYR